MRRVLFNKGYLKIVFYKLRVFLKEKFSRKSIRYGFAFFAIIPFFAIIYYFLPADSWNMSIEDRTSFGDFLYFSIVSITTLGFGDICPITTCSRFFVALESIGGIVFIGLFLNSLSSEQAKRVSDYEKERQNEEYYEIERNKLNLQRKMFETRINRYLLSAYCLVTPIEKRKFTDTKIDVDEITFNDMYDMFRQTLLLTQDINTSSLEMFLHVQDELFAEMSDLLKIVNVGYWTYLLIPMNNFMLYCVEFDYKDSLLGIKHMSLGGKPASECFSEIIKNHNGDLEFKPSNAMNQFIALFNLIVKNLKEIERIQDALTFIFRQEN